MSLFDKKITIAIPKLLEVLKKFFPPPAISDSAWVVIPGEYENQSHAIRVKHISRIDGVEKGRYDAGNGRLYASCVRLTDGGYLNSRSSAAEIVSLIGAHSKKSSADDIFAGAEASLATLKEAAEAATAAQSSPTGQVTPSPLL
jgi:uncharacterized protein YdeI (BOF family)